MAEVYLNGKFVGTIESGQRYVQQLVEKRRKGELPINCNAYYNQKTDTVEVENEKGRLRRPLIVVHTTSASSRAMSSRSPISSSRAWSNTSMRQRRKMRSWRSCQKN